MDAGALIGLIGAGIGAVTLVFVWLGHRRSKRIEAMNREELDLAREQHADNRRAHLSGLIVEEFVPVLIRQYVVLITNPGPATARNVRTRLTSIPDAIKQPERDTVLERVASASFGDVPPGLEPIRYPLSIQQDFRSPDFGHEIEVRITWENLDGSPGSWTCPGPAPT